MSDHTSLPTNNKSSNHNERKQNNNHENVYEQQHNTYKSKVVIQFDPKKMNIPSEISIKRDIKKYYEFKQILGT